MVQLRGSEIIADYLELECLPYVFGLCGHGNVGMLDTLRDRTKLQSVTTHHEAVAGFMADAYYRVAGRPVATLTSCGPGSAQLPVAMATALMDASAFLAITGNVPTQQFNRGPFQESGYHFQAEFPSVARPYVKRSYQATRPEQLPLMLRHGFNTMTAGRPGPVNLDVPLNVFVETADVELPDPVAWRSGISHAVAATGEDLAACVDVLLSAQRPLIVVGQAAAEASNELAALSARFGIPVGWTPDGKGVVDPRVPLHLGESGRNGTLPANYATRSADVILAIGARFDDRATSSWLPGISFEIPPTKLVQVEIEPLEIGRNLPVQLGLTASPRAFVRQLADAIPTLDKDRWAHWRQDLLGRKAEWQARRDEGDAISAAVPIRPEELLRQVRRVFPDNGILLADVGVHHNWIVQEWPAYGPGTLLQSWGFASMGFGLAGALGAQLAAPDRKVLTIAGDGGFLMLPSVVATAVEYRLPVVWLVWNNRGFISIRDIQRGYFGTGREFLTEFVTADGNLYSANHAAMAEAMGACAFSVEKPQDIAATLEAAYATGCPCVIDVAMDREAAPQPTGSWSLPPLPDPVPTWLREQPA